jgi:hydroxypyruvate isomerase
MGALAQSIAWWCFVPALMTPEQFVRTAAEAGFTAIDLVPPAYWELVTAHGLALSSIQGHGPLERGLNRRELHDLLEQEIRANIAHAVRYQIPNVLCFSGNRNGLDDAAGAEITAAGLARVAPTAEQAGVTLVLELLNSKVDHRDYQADHTDWGVRVCRLVGSPHVKLLYDIYHMQIMEGDIVRTIQAAHPFIGLYHTAGNPGRHDLDDEQELYYPAILSAIRDTGYTGYVAHEFIPKGDAAAALHTTYERCAPYL